MVDRVYVDSSAFVKRYDPREPAAGAARARMRAATPASSVLLIAEIMSALARKLRSRELPAEHIGRLRREARRDYAALLRIELTGDILTETERLLFGHALRAADAIHLASALSLARDVGEPVSLLTADRALAQAAQAEGLAVQYLGTE